MAAIAPMGRSCILWSEHMLKRAGLIILIVALFVVMFTFTALNTGEIELDLGFVKRTWPISVALAGTFVAGMLFGILCMTAFVFRLINERRRISNDDQTTILVTES